MLTILGVATQAVRMYTLEGIEVDADRQQIDWQYHHGTVLLSQQGDVNVADSTQIEQRHYSTITMQ